MGKCRYNLSKDCHGRDCVMCLIEDIKAEIKALTDGAEPERIWNVDVLAIIDKYGRK